MTDRARSRYVCIGIAVASVVSSRPSFAGEKTSDSPATTPSDPIVVAPSSPAASRPVAASPVAAPAQQPADLEPRVSDQSGSSFLSSEPIDTRFRADAMLGFAGDNLSLGFGVRGGKTLSNHLYLGGLLVYQIGTSTSTTTTGVTETGSVSGFYVGPEAGYDFVLAAAPVVIRPYLGLGLAVASGSGTVNGMTTSSSSSQLAIWPGVAGFYHFADSAFVLGGDLRFVNGPWGTAVGIFVVGGLYL
jgi:hypothetical protein